MQRISPSLFQLVALLNDLQIHSGESLAKTLCLSRNAIWKHVQQLLKYGVPIESWVGKGYQLKEPLSLLDPDRLSELFLSEGVSAGALPFHQVEIFGSIGSTNDEVRLLLRPPEGHLIACLAEHQTQGRGRFDRKWISPFGQNLMLSVRILMNKDMSSLGGLSLSVSLAVRKTLEDLGIGGARCKWPNDIYFGDKKLSGILMEAYAESHGLTELIIGIGLNVNMTHHHLLPRGGGQSGGDIQKPWTSVQEILSIPQDRTQIASALLQNLSLYLQRFLDRGFEDFKAEWEAYDLLKNQLMTLKIGTENITGIARGIDELGHLKIENSSGKVRSYSAGEASIESS